MVGCLEATMLKKQLKKLEVFNLRKKALYLDSPITLRATYYRRCSRLKFYITEKE